VTRPYPATRAARTRKPSRRPVNGPVITTLEAAAILGKRTTTTTAWLAQHGVHPLPDLGRNLRWSREAINQAILRAAGVLPPRPWL
jgi:hypothetical protein